MKSITTSASGYMANVTMVATLSTVSSLPSTLSTGSMDNNAIMAQVIVYMQLLPGHAAAAVVSPAVAPVVVPKGYCWTHGITENGVTHHSGNCKHPAEGHKMMATKVNPMGSKSGAYCHMCNCIANLE